LPGFLITPTRSPYDDEEVTVSYKAEAWAEGMGERHPCLLAGIDDGLASDAGLP
jgi:hypothetical protein